MTTAFLSDLFTAASPRCMADAVMAVVNNAVALVNNAVALAPPLWPGIVAGHRPGPDASARRVCSRARISSGV